MPLRPAPTRSPITPEELCAMVREEIELHGPKVDLNHISLRHLNSIKDVFKDTAFNGDISKWNVSRIRNMDGAFQNCPFNGDISNWKTTAMSSADKMFQASHFNGDISRWDTSRLIVSLSMFQDSKFNGDISNWNTENLTMMSRMFQNSSFKGDISKWNIDLVFSSGRIDHVFYKTPYPGDLSSWRITDLQSMDNAFSPEFQGVLPRSANLINKLFYVSMFESSKCLDQYLRTQAFGGVHFDMLRLSSNQPEWSNKVDYTWAQEVAQIGESIGMDDDALRNYAMEQYRNKRKEPLSLEIRDMALM